MDIPWNQPFLSKIKTTIIYIVLLCWEVIFCIIYFTAPNAPPANLQGNNASSTSIFVHWGRVPANNQNGIITNYTVTYQELPSGSAGTKVVVAPRTNTTLTGLKKYANYSITVFASTSKGNGNISAPIIVITDEDSKFMKILFIPLISDILWNGPIISPLHTLLASLFGLKKK